MHVNSFKISLIVALSILATTISGCKKVQNENNPVQEEPAKEAKINELFFDQWNDSYLLDNDSTIQRIDESVVSTDSIITNGEIMQGCYIMLNAQKKIVKISSATESESGDTGIFLDAYFDNGKLVFIDYLIDIIPEPEMSYFIKSAVKDDQFVPEKFEGKTRVDFGNSVDLPAEKASTECILEALVLYEQMKEKFEKK